MQDENQPVFFLSESRVLTIDVKEFLRSFWSKLNLKWNVLFCKGAATRPAADHPADHTASVVKGLVHAGVKSPTRGKSLVFISNFQEFLMKCCEVVICPLCQASSIWGLFSYVLDQMWAGPAHRQRTWDRRSLGRRRQTGTNCFLSLFTVNSLFWERQEKDKLAFKLINLTYRSAVMERNYLHLLEYKFDVLLLEYFHFPSLHTSTPQNFGGKSFICLRENGNRSTEKLTK